MNASTTNPLAAKPARIDEPALSFAALLALASIQPTIMAAIRKHAGNIVSRINNEAQDQMIRAEVWASEERAAVDEECDKARAELNRCQGRAEAMAWLGGVISAAFGLAIRPIPFEVPKHFLTSPPEPERAPVDRTCHACGTGEPGCTTCGGSGQVHVDLDEDFIASGAEQREQDGAPC